MGENSGTRSFAMGPEDVKKIIESRLLKKSKEPEDAIEELLKIADDQDWVSDGKWSLLASDESSEGAHADDGAVPAGSKRKSRAPVRLEPRSLAGPSTVNY
jgi:hypothetical protein